MGQLAEKSRHQRGPQLPIFKAESHPAVPMVFLRTLANMACSRGRGPANRLAGMVRILLPELRGSRKQKGRRVKRGETPAPTLHQARRSRVFEFGRQPFISDRRCEAAHTAEREVLVNKRFDPFFFLFLFSFLGDYLNKTSTMGPGFVKYALMMPKLSSFWRP